MRNFTITHALIGSVKSVPHDTLSQSEDIVVHFALRDSHMQVCIANLIYVCFFFLIMCSRCIARK